MNIGIPAFPPAPKGQASFTYSVCIKLILALLSFPPAGNEKGDINPELGLIHGPFMETTAIHPLYVE